MATRTREKVDLKTMLVNVWAGLSVEDGVVCRRVGGLTR